MRIVQRTCVVNGDDGERHGGRSLRYFASSPLFVCFVLTSLGLVNAEDRISVRVHPDRASVRVGGSVKLRAEVRGTRQQDVRWALSGKSALGRISADGTYFAPSSAITPATLTLTATSIEDRNAAATATIQIPEVRMSIAPSKARVQLGETLQLKAKIENSLIQDVTFSVEGKGRGTVSPAGVYTTADSMQTPTMVIVRATSLADKSKSATCALEVGAVETRISPDRAKVKVGGTIQFKASIRGTKGVVVVWSVLGGDSQGTISESGLYKTPVPMTTPAKVTVRAASASDPTKHGEAEVTVQPVNVKVSPRPPGSKNNDGGVFGAAIHGVTRLYLPFDPVSPVLFGPIFRGKGGALYLPVGGSYQFYAQVENTVDQRVRWSLEGDPVIGTINESGLFVAPTRLRTPASVVIRATSEADHGKSGLTNLTIPPIVVRVEPKTMQVLAGANAALKATVENSVNKALVWKVAGKDSGRITDAGLYTAPLGVSTPRTVTVNAISVADPTKETPITITIPEVRLEISQTAIELKPGETHNFSAKVSNAASTGVKWSIEGATNLPAKSANNRERGEVSVGGMYRAPLNVSEAITVRIVATSVADPSKTVVAVVRVRALR